MLYDVARGVFVHRTTVDVEIQDGATYLVVSHKGAEGLSLWEMEQKWVGAGYRGARASVAMAGAPPAYLSAGRQRGE